MQTLGDRLIQAAHEAREIIQRPVVREALALKAEAEAGPIGKKRSSFELYALLARCMALAVQCQHSEESRQDLLNLLRPAERSDPRSRKGMIVSTSSTFQLVCRFVFQHKGVSARADASNASRYGKALEQAWTRGIGPDQIEAELKNSGGVNALFQSRPVKAFDVRTKALRLTTSTLLPKDGEVTLTLRRRPDGSFDVLRNSYDLPSPQDVT